MLSSTFGAELVDDLEDEVVVFEVEVVAGLVVLVVVVVFGLFVVDSVELFVVFGLFVVDTVAALVDVGVELLLLDPMPIPIIKMIKAAIIPPTTLATLCVPLGFVSCMGVSPYNLVIHRVSQIKKAPVLGVLSQQRLCHCFRTDAIYWHNRTKLSAFIKITAVSLRQLQCTPPMDSDTI
jgi:hypothetical protein